MAFPKRWRCPKCNRVIENSKYCYYCGYGEDYGAQRSHNGFRKDKEKEIKKLPIIIAVSIIALVSILTFWRALAFKPEKKNVEIDLKCASPELIITLRNEGKGVKGTWVFSINGEEHKQDFRLEKNETLKKAFESESGLNVVVVKTPFGEEKEKKCFL